MNEWIEGIFINQRTQPLVVNGIFKNPGYSKSCEFLSLYFSYLPLSPNLSNLQLGLSSDVMWW
jgi:hypothetical protein